MACVVEANDLTGRLTALLRRVKNDLAEGGSNTLYLAVGFLRWKKPAEVEKTYLAPLLLVPIKLVRRSASSPFYLAHHDDDVRFNATLIQLLEQDFRCDVTSMESHLPTDDSGVDVPKVLEQMRRGVRDIRGFEVVENVAIARFSFAKYLMWKDLRDRVKQLEHNRVVRHLINDPTANLSSEVVGPMPRPIDIDGSYKPADIVHPLPADSSQLTAVMAASEGHDLVIVGPPGTGKSQTIANVIAQCLAVSKTVLFVAEKTAALDVVHRRLREHGLGDCCVELHSNKADRRRFLDQLEASWKRQKPSESSEWEEINEQLRVYRDQLNDYVAALHVKHLNGWTVYRAIGLCIRDSNTPAPKLNLPQTVMDKKEDYESYKTSVADLARTYEALPNQADLGRLETSQWTMAWQRNLLESCDRLKKMADALAASIRCLVSRLNLPLPDDMSDTQLSTLQNLARELVRAELPPVYLVRHECLGDVKTGLKSRRDLLERHDRASAELTEALGSFAAALGHRPNKEELHRKRTSYYRLVNFLVKSDLPPFELIFHPAFDELPEQLSERSKLLQRREKLWEAIQERNFKPTLIEHIKLTGIEVAWAKAAGSFWPLSSFRRGAIKKKLKAYMNVEGVADPEIDLPLLRDYEDCQNDLEEKLAGLGLSDRLKAEVEKDPARLTPLLAVARPFRDAISATGNVPEKVGEATQYSLEPLLATAKLLYQPDSEVKQLTAELKENLIALGLHLDFQEKVEQDVSALDSQIDAAARLRTEASLLGVPTETVASLVSSLNEDGRQAVDDYCRAVKEYWSSKDSYTELAGVTPVKEGSTTTAGDAAAQAERVTSQPTLLKPWTVWVAARKRAEDLGLKSFVDALQRAELRPTDALARLELAYARWWLPFAIDKSEPLRNFDRSGHEYAIDKFRKLDESALQAAVPRVLQAVYHDLPPSDEVPRKSELGLLKHQMKLKRPSKSIRNLIFEIPEKFSKLAPCLLMSPLSIAQYLPTDQTQFDVVIFDEASQIATWDAIGAIARGKQTIIVGDPKQLPPTTFFGRVDSDDDYDALDDSEKDLESILDEVQASALRTLQLEWHYRSRHESLITFSNLHYYKNALVTFPAAEPGNRGVSYRHVTEGIYDRGKSRTNHAEAEAIVADAVSQMRSCFAKPEKERLTYGVVTFNSQQQSLIQDLFDKALRDAPELEWFFADERVEPTAVKNLENVQGDERDVMYFSITFGKGANGKFPVDFGAINRPGGERRLNVAVTRARRALQVYASFLSDELRAERSSKRGVHDLKAFLEYAFKGLEAIATRTEGSVGRIEPPLPFEEAVANALKSRGWRLKPQVGVSGFRVDLGVINPDRPGAYLAGVACDGATYKRSVTARDRDKTRQQVLEDLGWKILRVWSADWYYDPDTAAKNLHDQITDLLKTVRESEDETSATAIPVRSDGKNADDSSPVPEQHGDELLPPTDFSAAIHASASDAALQRQLVARHATGETQRVEYQVTHLDDATDQQASFFADDYSRELRQMAMAVVQTESPVRDDVVARRVARAHGFARTGTRIKDRVLSLLPEVTTTKEDTGCFLWATAKPAETLPFRYPAREDERRSLGEIPMPELLGLVQSRPELAAEQDPAIAFAREIGLGRLAKSARARLEAAIEFAVGDH